jgi:peptidyl-prolyl cis-trans isomerase D
MLTFLRDRFKYLAWVLWLIVAVFVIYLIPNFDPSMQTGDSNSPTEAAKVGDDAVSMAEFREQYEDLEQQFRQTYGERFTPEVAKQMKLPIQALDRAIARRILVQEAENRGLRASDEEVRRSLLATPGLTDEAGNFVGETRYRELLAGTGRSVKAFETSLREELSVRKLTTSLAAATSITDADVEREFRAQSDAANLRYFILPGGRYAGQAVPSAEELRAHFDGHRAEFRLGEQRVVDYLLVDNAKVAAQVTVTDAELQSYYDEHVGDYTRPDQIKARHILVRTSESVNEAAAEARVAAAKARIDRGESFAQVASEVSEDPTSKGQGGDLGWIQRGSNAPEFDNAAFAAAAGQVVGPLRVSYGVHLILVEDKRPGGALPFEQLKPQIQARLQGERAQVAGEARAKALYAELIKGKAGEAELRAKADASGGVATLTSTAALTRDDVFPGIGRGGEFTNVAFAAPVGQAQAPVRTPRGWVILSVREVKAPRDPEFSEVEAKVRAIVERSKLAERARAELQTARAAMTSGATLDDVARGFGLTAQDGGRVTPGGSIAGLGPAPAVVSAALALDKGDIGGPIVLPQGALLFEVTERERFDPVQFAAQKPALRANLEREEAGRLLGALIEQKRQELKVTYSRQILEQFDLLDEAAKS